MADFFGISTELTDTIGNAVAELTGQNSTKVSRTKIVGDIFALGNEDKFYFLDSEAPEEFPDGGEQVYALHQFPGSEASRTIDTFGNQPVDIEFSGEISSIDQRQIRVNAGLTNATGQKVEIKPQTARQRSDVLKQFYTLGTPVHLRFGVKDYIGVVVTYKAKIHHENYVTYDFKFVVLKDLSKIDNGRKRNAALVVAPHINILHLISDYAEKAKKLFDTANTIVTVSKLLSDQLKKDPTKVILGGVAMVPGVGAVISAVDSLHALSDNLNNIQNTGHPQLMLDMQNAKPYQTLSDDAVHKVLMPEIQAHKRSVLSVVDYMTNDFAQMRIVNQRPTPDLTATAVLYAKQMASLLELLYREFAKLTTTQNTTVLFRQNPNLIDLAVRYYGDPSKWALIAKRNNLTTPFPIGSFQLVIPHETHNQVPIPALSDSVGNG